MRRDDIEVENELNLETVDRWMYSLMLLVPSTIEHGAQVGYAVELVDGKLRHISRRLVFAGGSSKPDTAALEKPAGWGTTTRYLIVLVLVGLLILMRRRALSKWKVALFLTLLFASATAYMRVAWWGVSGSLAFERFFIEFILAGTIAFLGFAVALEYSRRAFLPKVASLKGPSNWASLRYTVGLAVTRGALLGFTFLGVQNLIAEAGLRTGHFWVDPTLYADPSDATVPALYALANAIVQPLQLTFVGVALPLSIVVAHTSRRYVLGAMVAAMWVSLVLSGQLFWMQPWGATILFLFIGGLLLSSVLIKFDLLTLFFAMVTFELWLMGYPNFVLFRKIETFPFYAVFYVWASLILLGCWAYWGPSIKQAYRRVASAYE